MTRGACTLGLLILLAVASREAMALTESGTVGDVHFTVYAPDWTWQKQRVNVLFVLDNQGSTPQNVTVALGLPPGREDHFETSAPLEHDVEVPAGTTVRQALTDVFARDGVPRQVYDFAVTVKCGDSAARVAYPLSTVRGAAVSSAKWALFLPVVVALVWSVLFVGVMRRLAPRRAWRSPSPSVEVAEERELWIDQTPT